VYFSVNKEKEKKCELNDSLTHSGEDEDDGMDV
jgi:hypothetical protein